MTDLGPMGTATAASLREVGLEPAPRALPPAPMPRAHRPAPLVFRPALPFGRLLACAAVLAGAGVSLAPAFQSGRDQVREFERQTQRYLQALDQMEHVTELQIRASEDRERDLRAAVRRIEEYQARAVRAERRARRLTRGRRP